MVFQPVPLTAEAVVDFQRGGQLLVNTFYFTHAAGWGQGELDTLAGVVDTWVGDEYLGGLGAEITYVQTRCRDLRTSIGFQTSINAHAGVGLADPSASPNNMAWALSRRTGFTGRSARGRVYLPPLPENQLSDENHVSLANAGAWEDSFNLLSTNALVEGWVEVVVSRQQSGVRLAIATTLPVTQYIATDLTLDSQRRRLPGRGV